MMYNISNIFSHRGKSLKTQSIHFGNLVFIPLVLLLVLTLYGCGGGGASGNTVSAGAMSGSVTLAWDAPTTNSDGSVLTDLAGYKVYYGTSSGNYTEFVNIGNYTGTEIGSLASGTWCFAVTAYDTSGNESDYSDEVCKVI